MSVTRRALGLVSLVILFLIGGGELAHRLILLHAPVSWVRSCSPYFEFFAVKSVWTGALLAFLPLSILLLWLLDLRPRNLLVLTSEAGQALKIREEAINQYIHDDLMALPFVRHARIASRAVSGALAVKMRVWVVSAGPLDGLQNRILDRITSAARVGLGISQVADIDLRFEAVRLTRAEAKKRASEGKADRRTDASTPSTDPSSPDEAGSPSFAPPGTENRTLEGRPEGSPPSQPGETPIGRRE